MPRRFVSELAPRIGVLPMSCPVCGDDDEIHGWWDTDLEGEILNCDRSEVPALCQYSAKHNDEGVPAMTTINCGPVGIIPACESCAAFYKRMSR
jgi:hypothetical protein